MIQLQLSEGGVLVVLDYQAVTAKDNPGPVWYHELSCRAFDMPYNFSWERLHTLAITQDFTQYMDLAVGPHGSKNRISNRMSKHNIYRMATDPSVYVDVFLRPSGGHPYVTDVFISVLEQSNGTLIPRQLENDRLMPWVHRSITQRHHRYRPHARNTSCPGCRVNRPN